ncbi:endonuclease V [Asanoa iriomotensis]|uniref:Endonuclease V n=1 Tax=Asanoa iriomotensis TaxID=234613 RepID=A0ABQ4BWT1_9ACTN|nr:endonuclease V [Asanoa iriomotensis]GIF54982.1 endonuclease V [Asanoa iriomotensis]
MTDRYGAVDAHYPDEGGARAALVVAAEPRFATLVEEKIGTVTAVPAYRPGFFFERELPVIRAVLATTAPVDLLIVDGYVDLDPAGRPGLGARLRAEIDIPVVGVAKTAFRSATHAVPVVRGGTRPLYVTAAGIPLAEAAALVSAMAGAHRIPDALRRVDRLARSVPG